MDRVTVGNRAGADEVSGKPPMPNPSPPPAAVSSPSSIVQSPAPESSPRPDGRYRRSEPRAARDVAQRRRGQRVEVSQQTRVSMSSALAAEQDRLRSMSTAALVKQAISEVKLLAKAEVLHAKQELKEELQNAKVAGVLLGVCLGIGMCGLSLLFLALALALPLPQSVAALIVGGLLLLTAAACGAIGYSRLPKRPLQNTQQRIKEDLAMTRKQFA